MAASKKENYNSIESETKVAVLIGQRGSSGLIVGSDVVCGGCSGAGVKPVIGLGYERWRVVRWYGKAMWLVCGILEDGRGSLDCGSMDERGSCGVVNYGEVLQVYEIVDELW